MRLTYGRLLGGRPPRRCASLAATAARSGDGLLIESNSHPEWMRDHVGLHDLFDRVTDAAREYVDLIAERGVALGGEAEGTLQTVSRRSKLPEYSAKMPDWTAHVEGVRTALATFGGSVRRAIDEANDLKDTDTADLFTEVSRSGWSRPTSRSRRGRPASVVRPSAACSRRSTRLRWSSVGLPRVRRLRDRLPPGRRSDRIARRERVRERRVQPVVECLLLRHATLVRGSPPSGPATGVGMAACGRVGSPHAASGTSTARPVICPFFNLP